MLRSLRSSLLAVLTIMGTVPNARADWGQSPTASAQPQPLPAINLDNYPAVSRVSIARALATVKANPGDAERIGELGMMLQAWEQNERAGAVFAPRRRSPPALRGSLFRRAR